MGNFFSHSGEMVFSHSPAVQDCFIVAGVWGVCKNTVNSIFKACFLFEFFDNQMAGSVTVMVGLSRKGMSDYFD